MKVWKSFSGEHSSNLKIVATFKSVSDAEKAEKLFNSLLEISMNTKLSLDDVWGDNELGRLMKEEQCYDVVNEHDYAQLEYFRPLESHNNTITVKMDTYDVQPVVKTLLFYGASIEMFDLDSYPEKA